MRKAWPTLTIVLLAIFVNICEAQSETEQNAIRLYNEGFKIYSKAQSRADIDKALERLQQALAIFEKTQSGKKIYALNQIGIVYKSLAQYPEALKYFEQAVLMKPSGNDIKIQGYALNNIGGIYQSMGDYSRAIEFFERSLPNIRATGEEKDEAHTINCIGDCYRSLGEYTKALEYCERSLKMSRKTKYDEGIAGSLGNLGSIYNGLSQYSKALDYHEQALQLYKKRKDVAGIGRTLNNMTFVYTNIGQYEKALECGRQALDNSDRIGDLRTQAIVLNNIGIIYKQIGKYQESLVNYEQSLKLDRDILYKDGEANSLANIATVYKILGQYRKSLEFYFESLETKKTIGDLRGQSYLLANISDLYTDTGQYAKALEFAKQSMELKKRIGDIGAQAFSLKQIGKLYALTDRKEDALDSLKKAVEVSKSLGIPSSEPENDLANLYLDFGQIPLARDLVDKSTSNSLKGRLAMMEGDYRSALESYEKAVIQAEKTRSVDGLFVSYSGVARSYEGLRKFGESAEFYKKALAVTEDARSGLSPTDRINFFHVRIEGFQRSDPAKGLARVLMKLDKPEESIVPGELTKARSFAERLSQPQAGGAARIPEHLFNEEQRLLNSLAAIKQEFWKTDPEKESEKFENLSRSVSELGHDLDQLADKLRKNYPAYGMAKYPKPITLQESSISPNEYAILFDTSSEGVAVRLIHGKNLVKSIFVDWKQTDLEASVTKFRAPLESLSFVDFDIDLGRLFYDRLLRDILQHVPRNAPIIVMPDGPLAILPFDALVTEGQATWQKGSAGSPYPSGLTFLADEHPVTYYQSLTAMTLVRMFGPGIVSEKRIAVIADPVFQMTDPRTQTTTDSKIAARDRENSIELMKAMEEASHGRLSLKRLEGTSILADNLKKLFGEDCLLLKGLDASKADFMNMIAPEMENFGSLVFATHGAMSSRIPGLMEPFLALTMVPPGTDGFLRMSDILSLKMNSSVVALTACQTALGKDVSGEGVMSMGRAFQYAGAQSVVMTLWEVEESSATKLTESFFRHRRDGKTKLEALTHARNDVRNEGYLHPYFWSGFILVGETGNH